MKKAILFLSLSVFAWTVNAQSEKYMAAMEKLIPAVDTTRTPQGLTDLAAAFQRIAEAEKTQWLPYYYAALININQANSLYTSGQTDGIDPLVDKAEPLLAKADELQKNNSEIYVVKKMFNTAKMMADPMNRYMTYGPVATEALETAKKLDANNPRVYLQEGIDLFFTPEQFGGDKAEAKKRFEEAIKKYDAFKPASPIAPNWGRATVEYFLSQMKG